MKGTWSFTVAKGGSSQVASEKGEREEEHAVVVVGSVKSEEVI